MRWLKHAFAVDPPGPAEPTAPQRAAIESFCRQIVRRRLTAPALGMLEMVRPLNYLGAQVLQALAPLVRVVSDAEGYHQWAAFLEQRGAVDYLCRRIEELAEAGPAAWAARAATDSDAPARQDDEHGS